MARTKIGIGLLGLGVVGGGVARVLTERSEVLVQRTGIPIELRRVLVRELSTPRTAAPADLLTDRVEDILADPALDIVVEVMGGENPATEYILAALKRGKHVVTANKEVMAKHGVELLAEAERHGKQLLYEASVGGGIPIIGPMQTDLQANHLSTLYAIINGTTNYILTRMSRDGMSFSEALRQAQSLGYAEPNPANDVEGLDAAYKLAILATLAFHVDTRLKDVYYEGITKLTPRDFRYARELGYAIKLLAIAKEEDGFVQARVHPVFIPEELILAQVDGVFNAILVEGDLVGRLLFYGRGAGADPTASAIVADVMEIAQGIATGSISTFKLRLDTNKCVRAINDIETRYYVRMTVADQPGVLAQIARVLGDRSISIASVIQKEADRAAQSAEIVIMTHPAKESAMRGALQELESLAIVKEIGNFVRVED